MVLLLIIKYDIIHPMSTGMKYIRNLSKNATIVAYMGAIILFAGCKEEPASVPPPAIDITDLHGTVLLNAHGIGIAFTWTQPDAAPNTRMRVAWTAPNTDATQSHIVLAADGAARINNLMPHMYTFTFTLLSMQNETLGSNTIATTICSVDEYKTTNCDTNDALIDDADIDNDTILNIDDADFDGNNIGDLLDACANLTHGLQTIDGADLSLHNTFVPDSQGGTFVFIAETSNPSIAWVVPPLIPIAEAGMVSFSDDHSTPSADGTVEAGITFAIMHISPFTTTATIPYALIADETLAIPFEVGVVINPDDACRAAVSACVINTISICTPQ